MGPIVFERNWICLSLFPGRDLRNNDRSEEVGVTLTAEEAAREEES